MKEPVGQHHSLVRMAKEVAAGEWVARVFVWELVPGCYAPGNVVQAKGCFMIRKNDVGSVLGQRHDI